MGKNKNNGILKETTHMEIKVQNEVIENVKEFLYLGCHANTNNDCTKIKRSIAKAKGVMSILNTIWNSTQIGHITN